jgi:hypothetical protein
MYDLEIMELLNSKSRSGKSLIDDLLLELQPSWLSGYLLGEPERFTMVYNSTELLYALYCVYIGDQSPTEVMVIIKQFITMLRIQLPPYFSDSNTC